MALGVLRSTSISSTSGRFRREPDRQMQRLQTCVVPHGGYTRDYESVRLEYEDYCRSDQQHVIFPNRTMIVPGWTFLGRMNRQTEVKSLISNRWSDLDFKASACAIIRETEKYIGNESGLAPDPVDRERPDQNYVFSDSFVTGI